MRRFNPWPSPAMIVAAVALLVALGGTSVAATVLARSSVGTAQLKNSAVTNSKIASNAVTTTKVKNHSLLRTDFASGQIPAGPRGPVGLQGARGPTGPQGPAGTAAGARWAFVGKDGNLIAGSPGVTVQHPTAGNYYVGFGAAVTGNAVVATQAYRDVDATFRGGIIVSICGGGTEGATCATSNTSSTVHVEVENTGNSGFADHAFYLRVG